MQEAAESRAQVIRPNHDRQHALPERQMEKSDREQPRREPHPARNRVLLNPYLFHAAQYIPAWANLACQLPPKGVWTPCAALLQPI